MGIAGLGVVRIARLVPGMVEVAGVPGMVGVAGVPGMVGVAEVPGWWE